MQTLGVTPSGSGCSAKPEPSSTVSAVPASILNATLIADKLDAARKIIEERGWIQLSFESGGGVCAVGAMNRTEGIRAGDPLYFPARGYLEAVIGSQTLMFWNDEPGRTKEEVLNAFRKAAEMARAAAETIDLPPSQWTHLDAYMADIEQVRV